MTEDVALAADHAGFPLKTMLLARLKPQGYQALDVRAYSVAPGSDCAQKMTTMRTPTPR